MFLFWCRPTDRRVGDMRCLEKRVGRRLASWLLTAAYFISVAAGRGMQTVGGRVLCIIIISCVLYSICVARGRFPLLGASMVGGSDRRLIVQWETGLSQ